MPTDPTLLGFLIVVNIVAAAMAFVAWKWNDLGRTLFSLNFLGAALFNWVFLILDPTQYLYYADFTVLDSYRHFMLGPFTENLRFFLGIITIAQLLIAFGLAGRGRWLRYAALGAIVFLLAIAPLGLGAAFPATVIQSVGLFFIFRRGATESLPSLWQQCLEARKKDEVTLQ